MIFLIIHIYLFILRNSTICLEITDLARPRVPGIRPGLIEFRERSISTCQVFFLELLVPFY
jgi:hypothetical protein